MAMSMFTGCGDSSQKTDSGSSTKEAGSETKDTATETAMSNEEIIKAAAADGKVGNWDLAMNTKC